MLKICALSPSAELGGAEQGLLGFLKATRERDIQTTTILPRAGPLCERLSQLGGSYVVVPQPQSLLRLSRSLRPALCLRAPRLICEGAPYLFRLVRTFRRLHPDVIYTNGIKAHLLAALLRPILRRPVVWHVRDHWGGRVIGRIADLGTDRIIANSHATANNLQQYMRKPAKVTVLHNAVDVERFQPHGAIVDLAKPGEPPCPKIGLAAAFTRIKGHGLLLRAMEKVRREFPSVKCFFIGGVIYDTAGHQGYGEELRQLVAEKELAECVVFTGFQEEMAPWYRAMDVVVNASTYPEGFGRTLLEAMACGRAVVGPNAGGIPEFVRHGENGLLYEMGDVNALADALISLLGDAALRERLGAGARETAAQEFASDKHAAALSDIMRAVATT